MLGYVRPSNEALLEGARSGSTGPTWVASNLFSWGLCEQKEWPGCSLHVLVETSRFASKKGNQLPATSFCAPLSTLLPPLPCAAPRPSLAPEPSRRRGAAAETLQQKPLYAPPLS